MKYALVTGGSRGIGRAVSLKLASMGYTVLVNYVSNEAKAQETVDQIKAEGGDAQLLKFDVSDAAQTRDAITAWQQANPDEYIEVVVNNAGIRRDNLIVWMQPEDWSSVINTNLGGFYNVTSLLIKPMLMHRFGRVINMASLSGLKGMTGQTNYSAAKGGLIAATKALAQEVARKGITVNAVAPGFVRTDMVEGLDEAELKKLIPMNRFGEPEEVANLVGFLASKESSYITGECISINGGLYS